MAIRSAMRGAFVGHRHRRMWRQCESHGENSALPRPRAARRDVAAHAARELPGNGKSQAGAVRDAFTAAAIVNVEEFFRGFRREATATIADLETPQTTI